nr:MAG TPA: hypothetical protein [Bacteriophage sp.]
MITISSIISTGIPVKSCSAFSKNSSLGRSSFCNSFGSCL